METWSFGGFLFVAGIELDFPKWLGMASPFENRSLACPDSAPTSHAWACRTVCAWVMTMLSGSSRASLRPGALETHRCLFFLIDVWIPWACPEHGLRASCRNEVGAYPSPGSQTRGAFLFNVLQHLFKKLFIYVFI